MTELLILRGKTIVLFALLFICVGWTFDDFNKVRRHIEKGNFVAASEELQGLIENDPDNSQAHYYMGICQLELDNPKAGLSHLQKADFDVNDQDYVFYLASAYHQNGLLDEAHNLLSDSVYAKTTDLKFKKLKSNVSFARQLITQPAKVVAINLGDKINSDGQEYSSMLTSDQRKLFFTSRRKESARAAFDGHTYEQIFTTTLDSLDQWQEPELVQNDVSNKVHNASVFLFDKDRKIVTFDDGDLYLSDLKDGKWSDPEPIEAINTSDGAETHCFISDDGNYIYYATDNYSKNGDLDIYQIRKDELGEWGSPEPLDELNTPEDDDAPFLAEDGILYFSSRGHNSIGGYDIFKSEWNATANTWGKPENMGFKINSFQDDTFFNTFGRIAYLSSSRLEGYGAMDIYRVFLFDKIKIQGRILNSRDNTPIPGAEVFILDEGEKISTTCDEEGRYELLVPIEKRFDLVIEYQDQVLYQNKHRIRVLVGQVNDNIHHFYLDLGVNDQSNKTPVGSFDQYEGKEEDIYLKMVNTFGSDPTELEPDSEVALKDLLTLKIALNPEKSVEVAKKEVMPEKEKSIERSKALVEIYFDFSLSKINTEYKDKLDKLSRLLFNHNDITLKITGNTDNIGGSEFNKSLGLKRAKAIKRYLVRKGALSNQLIVESLGKEMPVTPNENEEGRKQNRRADLQLVEGTKSDI